jgi:hypothetical protein
VGRDACATTSAGLDKQATPGLANRHEDVSARRHCLSNPRSNPIVRVGDHPCEANDPHVADALVRSEDVEMTKALVGDLLASAQGSALGDGGELLVASQQLVRRRADQLCSLESAGGHETAVTAESSIVWR